MKKNILLLAMSIFFAFSNAQVGIGTTAPNSSAALDMDATSLAANNKKGLLLPRVALSDNVDKTTVLNPAVGLMVFNTATSGVGSAQVTANTFYYWNGVSWTNLTSLSEVRRELLPQVFFIAERKNDITTNQNVNTGVGNNINVAPVVVTFSNSSIMLNTGNNIDLSGVDKFLINNTGTYEISGTVNYNPSVGNLASTTNLEFIIQSSSDNGSTWANVAKAVSVWGAGTTLNNRSTNIPPVIINVNAGNYIRGVVFKTLGADHSPTATISAPTGLTYGKVLKIQRLK